MLKKMFFCLDEVRCEEILNCVMYFFVDYFYEDILMKMVLDCLFMYFGIFY